MELIDQSCSFAFLILLSFIFIHLLSCILVHIVLPKFIFYCILSASDEKIALLGAIQSLFEGSMYTFVFLWTPALSPNDEEIPHGFIFATFMLASMLGSSLASRLMSRSSLRVESYMQIVFAVSSAALMLPILTTVCYSSIILFSFLPSILIKSHTILLYLVLVLEQFLVAPSGVKGGSISFSGCIQLLGFCAFESCVGIFWPSIMKMRSQYIPEEARSTIMNFFRIPLNIFVCVVLYNVCYTIYYFNAMLELTNAVVFSYLWF